MFRGGGAPSGSSAAAAAAASAPSALKVSRLKGRAGCKGSLCTMNKIRKFFRGSGRVLAFIFAASIIWLLFDMAALRLSFSEINTRVLKEDVVRRERIGFRVQPDQMKVLYSSMKEIKPPLRGHGKGIWGRENFRKMEEVEDNLDQIQKERQIQKAPGSVTIAPLWRPVHLQTFPVTFTKPMTEEHAIKPDAYSRPVTPKQTTAPGAQETTFIAARGTPLPQLSLHTRPFAINQEAQKRHSHSSDTSKQAAERHLDVTVRFNSDRSKQKSQAVANERTLPASPPVPKSREALTLNKTEAQSKYLNAYKHEAHKNLPSPKFSANLNHLKKQSINETQLGDLPKDDGVKVAGGKKFNFSESHVVIITKEEELKTDTKRVPNPKIKTVFPFVLGGRQRKRISKNRNEASFSSLALQRAAVSQTNHILAVGLEPARISLNAKVQHEELSQRLTKALSPKDSEMHQVLSIDMTLSPRDPKASGQFGRPVAVPQGKEKEAERRWKEGNFNVFLSDLIPVDRAIEDTRPAG